MDEVSKEPNRYGTLTRVDFLLYSRLHFPSLHLSGLATTRLTPTLQAHLAFLHQPAPPTPIRPPHSPPASSSAPAQSSAPPSHSPPGNVLVSLQHDTGQWSGEYTFSAQDEMFGVRGMYNFGYQEVADRLADELASRGEGKRIDEEEAMEGGLRGRFSAGGEVYFSRKQRSFGSAFDSLALTMLISQFLPDSDSPLCLPSRRPLRMPFHPRRR